MVRPVRPNGHGGDGQRVDTEAVEEMGDVCCGDIHIKCGRILQIVLRDGEGDHVGAAAVGDEAGHLSPADVTVRQ